MTCCLAISDLVLDPILPVPWVGLIGVVLAGLTVYLYGQLGTYVSKARNVALLFFRLLGIGLVLGLLLQPSHQELIPPVKQDKITLVAVDTSLSMKQKDADRATRLDAAR